MTLIDLLIFRLRIHASDVSVSVSFTRSLCATFSNSKSSKKKSNDFTATLELVECSRSIVDPDGQDCQAPNPPSSRIWYSRPITDLYRRASFSATLDCSVWGQSGTFRVFLRANLTHSGVVARSEAVRVESNPEYAISSPEAQFVLPCVGRDNVRALEVGRPKCSGVQDRIRVYGQGK